MALPTRLPAFLQQVDGEIRAAGTRISLVDLVDHYRQGLSAEALAERFPTVDLAAIHHIIGFYIEHRDDVDAMVKQTHANADGAYAAHLPGAHLQKLRDQLRARHAARVNPTHAT